jgi:hypothetical protein
VNRESSILVWCDQVALDILREGIPGIEIIDCRGFEQYSVESILKGEEIEKELSFGRESADGNEVYCFVIFDGLENELIGRTVSFIKKAVWRRWIFATTTENNLSWKLRDLQKELIEEHNYFETRGDKSD